MYPGYDSAPSRPKALLKAPPKGLHSAEFRAAPSTSLVTARGGLKLVHYHETDHVELYDLDRDESESKDLAPSHPTLALDIYDELHRWRTTHWPTAVAPRNEAYDDRKPCLVTEQLVRKPRCGAPSRCLQATLDRLCVDKKSLRRYAKEKRRGVKEAPAWWPW